MCLLPDQEKSERLRHLMPWNEREGLELLSSSLFLNRSVDQFRSQDSCCKEIHDTSRLFISSLVRATQISWSRTLSSRQTLVLFTARLRLLSDPNK